MKLFGNRRVGKRTHCVPAENQKKNAEKTISFWSNIKIGKRVLLIVLICLFLLTFGAIAAKLLFVKAPEPVVPIAFESTIDPDTGTVPDRQETDANLYKKDYYNILLAGTDNDGTRTDTIMIARLDAVHHTVALLSIPRDSLVETGHGSAKINSVYGSYGCGKEGMEALMLEVEDLLGFMPTGYALVNLEGFQELVNVLGGVYYNVPQRMVYDDPTQDLHIDLYPGYQLLDGEHAMQLVRYRSYAAADIQRTKVQQDFLRTVGKRALSDFSKLADYCDIFERNVTTNFSVGNLLYFAQQLTTCDLDNMVSYTLPGEAVWIHGGSYYKLYSKQVEEIVKADFDPFITD